MLTREEILDYLSSRKEEFYREFQVTRIGLFGSYAIEEQSEDSDLDILIEFEPDTQQLYEKKNKIRSILSQRFRKEVDLCRQKFIKPYFKADILKTAIYV